MNRIVGRRAPARPYSCGSQETLIAIVLTLEYCGDSTALVFVVDRPARDRQPKTAYTSGSFSRKPTKGGAFIEVGMNARQPVRSTLYLTRGETDIVSALTVCHVALYGITTFSAKLGVAF